MRGEPHWFGPAPSTFGMVHWPSTTPTAGVVLCPPLGYEAVAAHAPLRLIAEAVSDNGVAALRIDFPGCGNSLRTGCEDAVDEWMLAITRAVHELRSFGVTKIVLAGLRFSATLAADLGAELGVDGLVLWDPVVSGRRYTRGMRLLATAVDDGIVSAGVHFDGATLAAMSQLSVDLDHLTVPTLVVQRAETSAETEPTPTSAAVVVERLPGTAALLDIDAEVATVPHQIVQRVVSWCAALFQSATLAPATPPMLCATAVEQIGDVQLIHDARRVGPTGLFTVTTSRADAHPRRAVIFLNNGVAPAIGPGSAWLDWAAHVARAGVAAVRLDFDGLGDSPGRPGVAAYDSYPVGAAHDVSDTVDMLRQRGIERVALLGLCSGALLAFDAAIDRAEIDHLVAINPRFDKPFCDRTDRAVRASGQTNRLFAVPLHKAPLFRFFDAVPSFVWKVLAMSRLVPRPTLAIERVAAKGTKIVLVFGPDEWGRRAMERRAPKQFAELCAHRDISVISIDTLDHSMFDPQARHDVEVALGDLFAPVLSGCIPSTISSSEVTSS